MSSSWQLVPEAPSTKHCNCFETALVFWSGNWTRKQASEVNLPAFDEVEVNTHGAGWEVSDALSGNSDGAGDGGDGKRELHFCWKSWCWFCCCCFDCADNECVGFDA